MVKSPTNYLAKGKKYICKYIKISKIGAILESLFWLPGGSQ